MSLDISKTSMGSFQSGQSLLGESPYY